MNTIKSLEFCVKNHNAEIKVDLGFEYLVCIK